MKCSILLAAAVLALGCENLAEQISTHRPNVVSNPSDDQSDESHAPPGVVVTPEDEPVDEPADEPDEPMVFGPHWPGPCIATRFADDPDSTVSLSRTEYAYDDLGRVSDEWRDENGDGTPELHAIQSHDSEGHPASIAWDRDDDGESDATTIYVREPDGSVRTVEDLDNDGVIDAVQLALFDFLGRPMLIETDSDADGSPETRQELAYDFMGRLSFVADTDLVAGYTSEVADYLYDSTSGLLARVQFDEGADGVPDRRSLHTFSPEGYQTGMTDQVLTPGGSSQTVTTVGETTYTLDAAGNLVHQRVERFDSGASRRIRYDYSCWE